jgi:hypothetical protein
MTRHTQRLTILAQDPSVRDGGKLMLAEVDVPFETLGKGPTGYRIKVVDFDATTNTLYAAHTYEYDKGGQVIDPFAAPKQKLTVEQRRAFDQALLQNPNFHAQHVYVVAMRTLARFEYALGRRVRWGFAGHQLHIAPHAFSEANAFYSRKDRALMFGYFPGKKDQPVFTCLSHDIVAHETTHALLDGLRNRYTELSGPDQAGFHEGFSDVVALLSMFSLRPVVEFALIKGGNPIKREGSIRTIPAGFLTADAIAESILFGLGEEFGRELDGVRANALRRSVSIPPDPAYLTSIEWQEPHARGEILTAALLRSFLEIWVARIAELGTFGKNLYNLDKVIDEGVKAADQLLTMVIRALDYCPPVDLEFGDYLAALLTVDREVVPDDERFGYREVISKTFARFGINVPAVGTEGNGCWSLFDGTAGVIYSSTNFESMLRDEEEVFRFIWENREVLQIDERGYTEVISVRPSVRQGPDGFILRETVCEYIQIAEMFGAEVKAVLGIGRPSGMSTRQRVTAYGGGVLIFDQYGRIKYHIQRRLDDMARQERRLRYLWENGAFIQAVDERNWFADLHRSRANSF